MIYQRVESYGEISNLVFVIRAINNEHNSSFFINFVGLYTNPNKKRTRYCLTCILLEIL